MIYQISRAEIFSSTLKKYYAPLTYTTFENDLSYIFSVDLNGYEIECSHNFRGDVVINGKQISSNSISFYVAEIAAFQEELKERRMK